MKRWYFLTPVLFLFLAAAFPQGAFAYDEGYALSTVIWDSPVINVCWEDFADSTAEQRGWVRGAVRRTWEANSGASFIGWNECDSGEGGIRIRIADIGPHVIALGDDLDGAVNGMSLNFTYDNWSTSCQNRVQYCSEVIAIHEFGHALGFAHEQNRPDTPDTCTDDPQGTNGDTLIGPWDLDSVMNYCNPNWNGDGTLSDTDIQMAQRFYSEGLIMERWATQQGGFWDTQQWLTGDFNGDGYTDFAKAFNDHGWGSIDVHISTGNGFHMQRWATRQGGFWDSQQWLAGDFNGDGYTDIGKAFNDGGLGSIDVHVSNGHSFNMQRWATRQGGFWDTQQWLTGDFNGDGYTDFAKAFNDHGLGSIDVHVSNGRNFTMQRWATRQGGFWNTQQWLTGDFNGDGYTDFAKAFNHNGRASIDTHVSTGKRFNMQRTVTRQGGFWDTQQWATGDFDGDGYTDFGKAFKDHRMGSIDVHRQP